ncbi:MAG: hypothetical protein CTY15_13585 [Methylocystis sp.]|nr:MAG: hypothetical protein CTY15_13585 [Methylocystis sp.]
MSLREYVWLNDMPVAVVNGVNTAAPVVYYVHTDHLGRPARMIAQSWAWVWDVIYSPFGAPAAIFDATAKLDMRFPGQWFQMESGLAYNWHRHYDASLGRYVQPDPIGLRGGRSLYSYALGSPLVYTDPDGEQVKEIIQICYLLCTLYINPLKIPSPVDFSNPMGPSCAIKDKKSK